MERSPLLSAALAGLLSAAGLVAACSTSPSAAAAPLPSSMAHAPQASSTSGSGDAVSSAPSAPPASALASASPSAQPSQAGSPSDALDAGALPDCSSLGPSKSVVLLPSTEHGMMSNANADASVDRGHVEIAATMQKRLDRLRCCYDFARQTRPGIEGALVMDFVLHPDGKVREAAYNKQKSEIKDDAMGACAAAVWSDLTFPPSKRGRPTTVSLPLVFRPGGGAR